MCHITSGRTRPLEKILMQKGGEREWQSQRGREEGKERGRGGEREGENYEKKRK